MDDQVLFAIKSRLNQIGYLGGDANKATKVKGFGGGLYPRWPLLDIFVLLRLVEGLIEVTKVVIVLARIGWNPTDIAPSTALNGRLRDRLYLHEALYGISSVAVPIVFEADHLTFPIVEQQSSLEVSTGNDLPLSVSC